MQASVNYLLSVDAPVPTALSLTDIKFTIIEENLEMALEFSQHIQWNLFS